LPRLEFSSHAEALTSILLMLKQERYVLIINISTVYENGEKSFINSFFSNDFYYFDWF
jgi:flagellar assembly factor FliW